MNDPKRIWMTRTAERVNRLTVDRQDFIDPAYTVCPVYDRMTSSGLLVVLRLVPNDPSLPTFRGRWHEEKRLLKFDIENVSASEKKLFKAGKSGFAGHHAIPIPRNTRTFRIDIGLPGRIVFAGVVTFSVHLGDRAVLVDDPSVWGLGEPIKINRP